MSCDIVNSYYFEGKLINSKTKTYLKDIKIIYYFDDNETNKNNCKTDNNGYFSFSYPVLNSSINKITIEINIENYNKNILNSEINNWNKKDNNSISRNYEYDFGNIEIDPTSDVVK